MDVILFFTVTALILVTIGLLGMFINTERRIREIERELDSHETEITNHKRDIRAINNRRSQEHDNIVIVHQWDDSHAPDYPSKGGF